ncbi:MAG TPA: penicillin-binding protein activator LpoB [Ramlibacter sp.]|uniref:penicillin-binding protein activator LpoB n=1 Tax=Ramlibacter sp. TaxID=1917967 RepID=UPI002D8003E0|nr:penicillin-binding protein activator LpoB [Ramlibacter sp.]HET8748994.1 penicillin-binding protein activator LpoB [Ramlibacter sp.]
MIARTLSALALASLAGCATMNQGLDNSPGRVSVYKDAATTSNRVAGVGVESQDVISMTDKMVRDILGTPQIAGRTQAPRIIVDDEYFSNESSSRLNKRAITDRLRVELNRSAGGRMIFLGRQYANMVAKERELKREGTFDAGTIRATKAQAGADFRLVGRITSMDANSARSGVMSRYHQITFELIDMEYGNISWSGLYEFKKEAQDDVIYR